MEEGALPASVEPLLCWEVASTWTCPQEGHCSGGWPYNCSQSSRYVRCRHRSLYLGAAGEGSVCLVCLGGGCGLEQTFPPGDWAGKGGGSRSIQGRHPALCSKGRPGRRSWRTGPTNPKRFAEEDLRIKPLICPSLLPQPHSHLWLSPGHSSEEPCRTEPQRKLGNVFIIFIIYTQKLGGRVCLLLIHSACLPPRLETNFQLDQDLR